LSECTVYNFVLYKVVKDILQGKFPDREFTLKTIVELDTGDYRVVMASPSGRLYQDTSIETVSGLDVDMYHQDYINCLTGGMNVYEPL